MEEVWSWQIFWEEFSLPVLVASVIISVLGMALKWAWTHGRKVISWSVLWLMVVTFLGLIFMMLQPSRSVGVVLDSGIRRPYFTQTQAAIQDVSPGIRALMVSVQNNDSPAEDVVSQLLVLEESLDPTIEPLNTKRVENANPIGPGGTLSQYWFVDVKKNARPAFVVFEIRYTDALRNETHSQALFLKFLGSSQDGIFIQQLSNATSDEKTRMESYLMERGIPTLSDN